MNDDFTNRIDLVLSSLPSNERNAMEKKCLRLQNLGIRTFDSLLDFIVSGNTESPSLTTAIWLIGRLGKKSATSALIKVFQRSVDENAWEAAVSLGLLGSRRAVKSLLKELNNEGDDRKRTAAAYALGLIGDARSSEALQHVLRSTNESASLRGHAAEALGHLGSGKWISALIESLSDEFEEVVLSSVYALGEIGDAKSTLALRQFLSSRSHERFAKARRLAARYLDNSEQQ